MPFKIADVTNPMIGKSSLPDFFLFAKLLAERVRVSAFDELYGSLQRHIVGWCKQQVHMLGHQNESVQ